MSSFNGTMIYQADGVREIRNYFGMKYSELLNAGLAAAHSADLPMLEIIGASFVADEDHIFGAVNQDYVRREFEWYLSESLSVYDIPNGPPKIWKDVASREGKVNSNYGYLLFNEANGSQFNNVIAKLQENDESRQAIAIYTRPTMHDDAATDGMTDFVCTNTVQYQLRTHSGTGDSVLFTTVNMRSNDAVYGYRNDLAWQKWVSGQIAHHLGADVGPIQWNVGNLHIYPRHFKLLDEFIKSGVHDTDMG